MKRLAFLMILGLGLLSMAPAISLAAGTLSLSRTSVSLEEGEHETIRANSNFGARINITSIDDSSVAYANVSGEDITIYGLEEGDTDITFCTYDNYCGTVFVRVDDDGDNDDDEDEDELDLTEDDLDLEVGDEETVRIRDGSGDYFIDDNSDDDVADADISGSRVEIEALDEGTTRIRVCDEDTGDCATLRVTVGDDDDEDFDDLELSDDDLEMETGDEETVTIDGGSGDYFIDDNSDEGVAFADLDDDELTVEAEDEGTTRIRVCDEDTGDCVTLDVDVDDDNGSSSGSRPRFRDNDLPQPRVGQYYSHQLRVTGGRSPYRFRITSGSLPSGLGLSSEGFIFGTPTSNSERDFTIRVTDRNDRTESEEFSLRPSGSNGGTVHGSLIYANGTLVVDNGTIYAIYKNTKSGITSMMAFYGLGYGAGNLVYGSTSSLTDTGYVINSANIPHPWGTWVKNGNTVYFVHESGLIPVSSYDIFLNNGGTDAKIVPMNWYDSYKPLLSGMTWNDSRLQP
jgi:hypothetical protein